MRRDGKGASWLQQAAVAVAYAIGFCVLREWSFSHWLLFVGLRLGALLLVPYRYWPALVVGELLPLAQLSLDCLPDFGWLWSLLVLIPPIALAMPVAYLCRERLRLFTKGGEVDMGVLLLCTLLVSVVWTLSNTAVLLAARLPSDYPALHYPLLIGRWFLGNYLGALTVVPLVLIAYQECPRSPWRAWVSRLSRSPLFRAAIGLLLPSLLALVWLARVAPPELEQPARMAMFFPVVWLALRHGWRGAAVGGTAASIAVVLTMPARYDYGTLVAQVFIAFTISTMLLFGARMGALLRRERQGHEQARATLALAQRNVLIGEMQLQQASLALEQARESVQTTYGQLIGRLRHLLPDTDERGYHRQAVAAQEHMYFLADSLYPQVWRERGLVGALREGVLARLLGQAGIAYWCDFSGQSLGRLSPAVHLTVYRLSNEAVTFLCSRREVSEVHVRVRSGTRQGRRWVMLCIHGRGHDARLKRVRWEALLPRLTRLTSGLGLDALHDRARVFEGGLDMRRTGTASRIRIVLLDPRQAAGDDAMSADAWR